ncbi:hypothetical protein [Lachnobacterium bovis]|uniref:Uncharacterized protein n=1 Tax=Lachnobacterium bovis TaxID=140626 RepID=A0A1H9RYE3_9FIRM|nr:hypothetical protein [Lachnobacterium bovis]SER77820.1 hypothetical protein SAMN02910429_01045 [Lachnobacterium bovis]
MGQVVKSFLGVFLIMFLVATSVSIISVFLEVMNAQNEHASIINEIENSDFNNQVITQCVNDAKKKGYTVSTKVFYEDLEKIKLENKDLDEAKVAKVELKFPINIAFWQLNQEYKIEGYAR